MNDKKLLAELLKMLDRFEQKVDWVGETPIRRRVSEQIATMRITLREAA